MNNNEIKLLSIKYEPDSWSISPLCMRLILENLEKGSTLLEFGSGYSTQFLEEMYNIYSVEDNSKWLNKYHNNYIYCPLKNHPKPLKDFPKDKYWYDGIIFDEKISKLDYDALLIDGPYKFRGGLINHLHILKKNILIIVDDVHRPFDLLVAKKISEYFKRPYQIYEEEYSSSKKKFAIFYPQTNQ